MDTVERLAIASAHLDLGETVTPAHVETAVRLYDGALAGRSVRVSAARYWCECVDSPESAFRTIERLYSHIVREAFDRHDEPVSMEAIRTVAADYGVDAETSKSTRVTTARRPP